MLNIRGPARETRCSQNTIISNTSQPSAPVPDVPVPVCPLLKFLVWNESTKKGTLRYITARIYFLPTAILRRTLIYLFSHSIHGIRDGLLSLEEPYQSLDLTNSLEQEGWS